MIKRNSNLTLKRRYRKPISPTINHHEWDSDDMINFATAKHLLDKLKKERYTYCIGGRRY